MTAIRDHLRRMQPLLGRLEACILTSAVVGRPKEYLIAHDDVELSDEQEALLESMLKRRTAGEPIAYILGRQEFFGRMFEVNRFTLIPRPDTELIVEKAIEAVRGDSIRILDLGTGSGCIAASIKCELPHAEVWATDFSEGALETARRNAAALGVQIEFRHGSWFDALAADDAVFDIIVSNPPYIEPDDQHLEKLIYEPISALTDGVDGMQDLAKIVKGAPGRLKCGGCLLLEHGWNQGAKTRDLFSPRLWCSVETIKDYAGNDRVTKATLK